MKKNRIFTSALAAVVLLAAGCSDELENQGTGMTGGELNGPQTYMKVSVNPGMVTKATAGEEGEGENQSEEGNQDEYAVKDVTVFLFRDAGDEYTTEPTEFKADSKLVAAGFGTIPGNTDPNNDGWHKRIATVTLDVTQDEEDFNGNTYGIIAVANLGDSDGNALKGKIGTEVKTGAQLANLLQASYKGTGFIMSTHNDQYGTSAKIFDKVTLKANVNPNSAPEAVVHVERLAAKVRISEADASQATDFIYKIEEDNQEVAKVRLDEVVIVNQLNSGSFLLKRVTTDAADGAIPTKTDGHDNYLGNENATDGVGTNYVIDPWTRNKNVETITDWGNGFTIVSETIETSKNLSYTNHFVGDNYADMWKSFTTSKPVLLANSYEFTDDENEELDLVYTMENTTSAAMSKNGFSTGALFKATYIPRQLSTIQDKPNRQGKLTQEVVAKDVDNYNPGGETLAYANIAKDSDVTLDFYLYGNNAYDSYEAIFNEYVWGEQKGLDGVTDATIYSYSDLIDEKIKDIKVADFFKHVLGTTSDPLGYFAYMRKTVTASDEDRELTEDEINALGEQTFGEIKGAVVSGIDEYIKNNDGNTATLNKHINKFEDCVCYYPYWIRHADNNSIDMGVMEFGIVRNNIYDMKVTGISGYGYSGIEKPVPGTDDELKKFFFNVEINVKNWVVRSNDDIIL